MELWGGELAQCKHVRVFSVSSGGRPAGQSHSNKQQICSHPLKKKKDLGINVELMNRSSLIIHLKHFCHNLLTTQVAAGRHLSNKQPLMWSCDIMFLHNCNIMMDVTCFFYPRNHFPFLFSISLRFPLNNF